MLPEIREPPIYHRVMSLRTFGSFRGTMDHILIDLLRDRRSLKGRGCNNYKSELGLNYEFDDLILRHFSPKKVIHLKDPGSLLETPTTLGI